MNKNILITFSIFLFISCATTKKMNNISIGMSKEQSIKILGQPNSSSTLGKDKELLNYHLRDRLGNVIQHYVLIEFNEVKQFGRRADFTMIYSNTEPVSIEIENKAITPTEKMERELLALKRMLEDKILTQEEYDLKKKEVLKRY